MRIVCLGDSNTYGFDPRSYFGGRYGPENRWVDILAEKTGWEITNEGENGRSIPRWEFELQMLQRTTIDPSVDLLIIMLGSNDLLQGADAHLTSARMEAFLSWLPVPPERILLLAPPPMQPGAWILEDRLLTESLKLASLYRELADRWGTLFADPGTWNISLAFDGAHFTEAGHRSFAKGLCQFLADAEFAGLPGTSDRQAMGNIPEQP